MSTGPNPILDDLKHRWDQAEHRVTDTLGDWFHPHHPTSAAQAAATPTIRTNPPKEGTMNLAELKNDVHSIADRLETLDEEALAKLDQIRANPEAMGVFNDLAAIAGVPGLPAGILTTATTGLKVIAGMSVPAQQTEQPPAAPEAAMSAGPVVGGQA